MTKEMKVNVAILVSFITIIGTIVAGGVAFGALEEGLREQKKTVSAMEERALRLELQTYEINTKVTEVATDLRWIRLMIEQYASTYQDQPKKR